MSLFYDNMYIIDHPLTLFNILPLLHFKQLFFLTFTIGNISLILFLYLLVLLFHYSFLFYFSIINLSIFLLNQSVFFCNFISHLNNSAIKLCLFLINLTNLRIQIPYSVTIILRSWDPMINDQRRNIRLMR